MSQSEIGALVLLVLMSLLALVAGMLLLALFAQRPKRQLATPTPLPMPRPEQGRYAYRAAAPLSPSRTPTYLAAPPPPQPVLPPAALLLIHTGPLRNTRFPVERPSVVLGRSSLSDVTLPDLQASRRHARLEWHSDGLYLVDNHSTNGTYVNSRPIEQVRLFGGEQVQIGGTIFTIRLY